MKKDFTELVFILDRSGSMGGLEKDTIGGFNSMLEKQRKEEGEVLVTTVLFDNMYELLHDRINLKGIKPMTDNEYYVRGTTALIDAIGLTINKISNIQNNTSEEERARQVIFIITTDGMENASVEFTADKVRQMIEEQKEKNGWEFLFLGANIDAVATARNYGIDSNRAVNYHSDKEGTLLNYAVISEAVTNFRAKKGINDDWKEKIDQDFKQRKSRS